MYSELGYVPARQTTLLHRGALKADGGSEKPTADGQHDIKIQEAGVRAQPGDASSSAVPSWELDGHGRAGRQLDRVVLLGNSSEMSNSILQQGDNVTVFSYLLNDDHLSRTSVIRRSNRRWFCFGLTHTIKRNMPHSTPKNHLIVLKLRPIPPSAQGVSFTI